jgi:adenine deaminase
LILVVSCKNEQKESYDIILKNGNVINIKTGAIEVQDIFINEGYVEVSSKESYWQLTNHEWL